MFATTEFRRPAAACAENASVTTAVLSLPCKDDYYTSAMATISIAKAAGALLRQQGKLWYGSGSYDLQFLGTLRDEYRYFSCIIA